MHGMTVFFNPSLLKVHLSSGRLSSAPALWLERVWAMRLNVGLSSAVVMLNGRLPSMKGLLKTPLAARTNKRKIMFMFGQFSLKTEDVFACRLPFVGSSTISESLLQLKG